MYCKLKCWITSYHQILYVMQGAALWLAEWDNEMLLSILTNLENIKLLKLIVVICQKKKLNSYLK